MNTITRLLPAKQREGLERMAQDLGWSPERLAKFCERQCGHGRPLTTKQGNQVYHGLEHILLRLMRPYWGAFTNLVARLCAGRGEMNEWERGFITTIQGKLETHQEISPMMIKKVREIAHKYDVPCGFPNFSNLAAGNELAKANAPRAEHIKAACITYLNNEQRRQAL
jgi:hypothetical protein